jgi:hypothetical protein
MPLSVKKKRATARKRRCAPAPKRRGARSSSHDSVAEARRRRKQRCRRPRKTRHLARKPAPKPIRKPAPTRPKPVPVRNPLRGSPDPVGSIPRPAHRQPSPIASYSGSFGRPEAERLLWRAGFGPSPGAADSLAALGLDGAVESLISPQGAETFTGPEPVDGSGKPLAPEDAYGHDLLFWLDRMVRTNQPFVQRMALIWHDWFATSHAGVDSQKLMIEQYELFRRVGRGSFEELLRQVTMDPAMILWLNANENRNKRINENYAREVMELFTLGADRGAYTEQDVRELARSLSGWVADWSRELGWNNFRWIQSEWDPNPKKVFGRTGNFSWEHAYRLCVYHPKHPSFFVAKLWSYFIPTAPSDADVASLEATYVNSDFQVIPVVRAILKHPALYQGPRMVKPPAVFAAGLLRALARRVDRSTWDGYMRQAGQRIFEPPNVSGWDDSRWLDTSTEWGRWLLVRLSLDDRYITGTAASSYSNTETADQALASALAFWGDPGLTAESKSSLRSFAASCLPAMMTTTQQRTYRAQRQNALRQLVAACPDFQTS